MPRRQPGRRPPREFLRAHRFAGDDLRHHSAQDRPIRLAHVQLPLRQIRHPGLFGLESPGQARIRQRARLGQALDPVRRHRDRFIAQRHQPEPVGKAEILPLPEPQDLEGPQQRQVAAHPGLQIKRPGDRLAPARPRDAPQGGVRPLRRERRPPQRRRDAKRPLAVLVQHYHAPVRQGRDARGIRHVHTHRHAVVLLDIRHVAELDAVRESRPRLARHEPFEEQAVLQLEPRDREEEQRRHSHDTREQQRAQHHHAPVQHLAHPPQQVTPVSMHRPGRRSRRGTFCDRTDRGRVAERYHKQEGERAGREREDLGGEGERDREHAGHHDQEEPQHHDLQVVAALAVTDPAVQQQQNVQPHDWRQHLHGQVKVAREEHHDRREGQPVHPAGDAGRQGRTPQHERHRRRREAGQGPRLKIHVQDRADRQQDEQPAEEPLELLELVGIKLRPPWSHRHRRQRRAPRRARRSSGCAGRRP